MEKEGSNANGFGICSVIFGILSIVFALGVLFGSIAGIAIGILGFVFSMIQIRKSKNNWAYWGLGLSIFGVALNIVILAYLISALSQFLSEFQKLQASAGGIAGAAQ